MLAADPAGPHGWGRYTRDLIVALAPQGIEIVLITAEDATKPADLPVAGYHRVLPSLTPAQRLSSLRLLRAIAFVRRLVIGCDVVHVVAEPYVLAAPSRFPMIVTAHGTYVPQTVKRPLIGTLYRYAYRRSALICVSSYTERQVRTAVPDAKTVVIPNGVDVARYRQPVPLPAKNAPTILVVGQIKARKGFHILAQALPQIRAAIPNAEAVFIGDTSDQTYCESIRAQLAANGLSDAVHWLGRVPDETLLGWYQAADVFALPAVNVGNRFEGFGLVYLEASAAGLPVIGTLDCGAEDAIWDGETGYLVPQNDPDALAQAAIHLLSDPELRTKLGSAGAAYAEQHTWDQVAQRVIDVYQTAKL